MKIWEKSKHRPTRIMEKERVIGPRVLDEPMHSSQNVLLRRLAHRVLLVVSKNNHIFALVAKMFNQVGRHVSDIVDASSELASLAEIVYADEKSFPSACAIAVLKSVSLRSAVTKMLRSGRRRGRGAIVAMIVRVRVCRR